MELWPIVIIFLAIAIILLIVSFFVKEDESPLLGEVADFTMQLTEEVHELRARINKIEAAMDEKEADEKEPPIKKVNAVTKQQVLSLHQKGKTYDEIADQLNLAETTVQLIVDNHQESLTSQK